MSRQDILRQANDAVKGAIEAKQSAKNEADRKFIVANIGKDLVEILTPLLQSIAEGARLTKDELRQVISEIKVEVPKVDVRVDTPKADVLVTQEPIKIPEINTANLEAVIRSAIQDSFAKVKLPKPEVNVKVPEQKPPIIDLTPIKDAISALRFPERVSADMDRVNNENPLPVLMVDGKGKPMAFPGSSGGKADYFTIKDIRTSSGASVIDQDEGGIKIIEPSRGSVGDNRRVVTTAGTRVQLDAQACKRIFVQAESDNTGIIVVGGSTVVAAAGSERGILLFPTNGQWFNINNANLLYIDSTVNGDGVSLFYEI